MEKVHHFKHGSKIITKPNYDPIKERGGRGGGGATRKQYGNE